LAGGDDPKSPATSRITRRLDIPRACSSYIKDGQGTVAGYDSYWAFSK
jgi:hypothetical protein